MRAPGSDTAVVCVGIIVTNAKIKPIILLYGKQLSINHE